MNPIATAPRYDLFTPIHKGMRRLMFETAVALARTDFSDAGETASAQRAATHCLTFLREHAEHEDRHIVPLVARAAPALAETLEREHPALERAAIAVDSLWSRIAALEAAARFELGHELVRRFQTFIAEQLRHMEREEREVNAALWAGCTDAELGAASGRIISEIAPARLAEFGAILAGALSRPELAAMAAQRPQATA